GVGWSSSLTRLAAVIPAPLLGLLRDLPDRDRRRVATEGRAEVGLRQVLQRPVLDHGRDPLVELALVRRALRVDRAVLLTGLVLPDDVELAAGRLGLSQHDRGVEEVGVDLAGEQTLVEGLGVRVDLDVAALELVLDERHRGGPGVRRTRLGLDV